MRQHAWSLDPAGQAAIRRAEDGRTDAVPTLDELFAAVPWRTPPVVQSPPYQSESRARDCQWRAALRMAGVEVAE